MLEPHEAYELYTRQQDEAYERLINGKTHKTCSYSEECVEGCEDILCNKFDTCVPRDEYVQGVCDCYTED